MMKTEITWDVYSPYGFLWDIPELERPKYWKISRPSQPFGNPDFNFGKGDRPALAMSFFSAQEFCKWLSEKTGQKYRLPSEAEWEYAARAGAELKPMSEDELKKVAWFKESIGDEDG